jgi:predicted phage tail protein
MRHVVLWGFCGCAVLLSLVLSTAQATSAVKADVGSVRRKVLIEESKNDFERSAAGVSVEAVEGAGEEDKTTSSISFVDRWTNAVIGTDPSFTFYVSAILLHTAYFMQAMLGPILSLVLRVLYRLVVQPVASNVYNSVARILPSDTASSRSPRADQRSSVEDSYTGRQAQSTVKTAKEDQRALKGDRRDIERLRRYGYQKYRYLSPGFLQRNGLSMPVDGEDLLAEEEEETAVVASRGSGRRQPPRRRDR